MGKRVTIRDVAEHCGYSIYTVSCVLNNKGSISQATRKKVQQAIRRLGYDPLKNIPLARNLAARTIALMLPDYYSEEHPFYFRAVSTLREFASAHGCDMKLFTVADFISRLAENQTRSLALGFDSLVVFCCDPPTADIRHLADRGIPVAMIRRTLDHPGVIMVTDDDTAGITLALDHLHADHGHTHIGLLASEFHEGIPALRRRAYLDYVKAHGLSANPRLQIETITLDEPLGQRLEPLIRSGDLTALLCSDDGLAVAASKAVLRLGLRIGNDVAITGYNNSRDADLFHPGITSVDIPVRKMVGAACQALLSYDPAVAPASTTLRFANSLTIRESCGCDRPEDQL